MDELINKISERSEVGQHSPRPVVQPDRPHHGEGRPRQQPHDINRLDNNFRSKQYYKAVCADCKKECEVPFKPSGDRPVYCKDCFSKRKNGGTLKATFNNMDANAASGAPRHFDKREGRDDRDLKQHESQPGNRKASHAHHEANEKKKAPTRRRK
ncbi:MAG: hypothetical protein HQL28_02845 [Candidatus Omnitrophica bacterium]|nr:hypothetical protein [Candidatus Omnitrophota bacterium]